MKPQLKRLVILDRDGVINKSKLVDGVAKPPATITEVEILGGVIKAIKILYYMFNTIAISFFSFISGIILRVTENDGWKYGKICSRICRASS